MTKQKQIVSNKYMYAENLHHMCDNISLFTVVASTVCVVVAVAATRCRNLLLNMHQLTSLICSTLIRIIMIFIAVC